MFTDIISYYFVIRIRKDIFLSYVFIFELGLLKLHSVERRSGFFLRRVCYLHMRGDRFFFSAFTPGVGTVSIYRHCRVRFLSVGRGCSQNHVQ